jgi:hypothetical protein
MALSTAKKVEVFFDQVMEAYEEQDQMAVNCDHFSMVGANAQNSNNVYWRQVQQQAPVQSGWEFTDANFGDVIELSYPSTLATPDNDLFKLRADDFRDRAFMDRRAKAAAMRLGAFQNTKIANAVTSLSAQFYRSSSSGYDFIKTGDTILREQQVKIGGGQPVFYVNDRTAQAISSDLAGRQTLQGIPDEAYRKGMMYKNTAGFDIYESSFLPSLAGTANPGGITVTSTVSQAPVANQTLAGGVVVPVDYRISDAITLTGTLTNLVVGDVITFSGVNSVGKQDKTNTGQPKTFRIVAKSGQTIQVYPRPIAVGDAGLTPAQAAYANISAQIAAGATVTKLNIDTLAQANVFWMPDSVEIVDGDAPLELLSQLDGMEVKTGALSSGTRLYIAYQGKIEDLTLRVRLFTWNNVVVRDPERCGVAIKF